MQRLISTQAIDWFLDLNNSRQLIFESCYLKQNYWKKWDKEHFLDTIMHNYPTPPVYLHKRRNDDGKFVYFIVDGRQRLRAIVDFAQSGLEVPIHKLPIHFTNPDLNRKSFDELDGEAKQHFLNYPITVEILPDVSIQCINDIFGRLERKYKHGK